MKRRDYLTGRDQKGNVLLTVLLTTVILIILSGAYMSMVASEYSMNALSSNSITAINVAEAGAEEALCEFKFGGANFFGWGGVNPVSKSDELFAPGGEKIGEYYVEAEDPATFRPTINATGYIPTQASPTAQRQVTVKIEADYVFGKAAFGVNGILMDSNAMTDSYDSTLGDYNEDGNKGSEGNIGTNATGSDPPAVTMLSNANVNGDVWIGPGGDTDTDISVESSASVTGRFKRLSTPRALPSVQGDPELPNRPPIYLDGDDTDTISESGKYSSIVLDSNSILSITDDVTIYITGEFHLMSNSQLHVTNGAEVEIYVDGDMYFDSNSQVNNYSKDPTKFAIYGTDSLTTTVCYDSNSSFYGTLYARNADVVVDSNAQFYGALLGKNVILDSNAGVHYDVSLRDISSPIGYEVLYWQEK